MRYYSGKMHMRRFGQRRTIKGEADIQHCSECLQKESEYLSGNHGKFEVAGDRDMFYVNAIKLPRLISYVLHFKNQNND